ncbi:hypothetical protein [Marinicella marina]|uniref:hypothetical protein n=1 Tax=Marinicella marina TaxID=2996016 RepID=UPI0024BCB4B6|nr:hypothetical protein [Marinicella marina]MDJ1139617.1 hypothetical protein [Marinicella marina]
MKRTIEINDTLQERVDQAISELKEYIIEYMIENPDTDDLCLSNDIDYDGRLHQIVYSNTPIYYYEIDGLWYLYKHDFIEAFENAGLDGQATQNSGMTAIYLYIEQECWEWWNSIESDLHEAIGDIQLENEDEADMVKQYKAIECLQD